MHVQFATYCNCGCVLVKYFSDCACTINYYPSKVYWFPCPLLLQGSYGRLGLGNSDSQSSLKEISTFPPGTIIRRMASSRGSDGHSQAITSNGEVFSWGDGKSRMFSLYSFLSFPFIHVYDDTLLYNVICSSSPHNQSFYRQIVGYSMRV